MKTKNNIFYVIAAVFAFYFLFMKRKLLLTPPVKGRITSKFGTRVHPITKEKSFHTGTDIAVPVGTQVKNTYRGTVSNVFEDANGGKQLIVQHDLGHKTGYAHLSKNNFYEIGEVVEVGDVIALTGNTGRSTGPHLHFTVRDASGDRVDPEEWYKLS